MSQASDSPSVFLVFWARSPKMSAWKSTSWCSTMSKIQSDSSVTFLSIWEQPYLNWTVWMAFERELIYEPTVKSDYLSIWVQYLYLSSSHFPVKWRLLLKIVHILLFELLFSPLFSERVSLCFNHFLFVHVTSSSGLWNILSVLHSCTAGCEQFCTTTPRGATGQDSQCLLSASRFASYSGLHNNECIVHNEEPAKLYKTHNKFHSSHLYLCWFNRLVISHNI